VVDRRPQALAGQRRQIVGGGGIVRGVESAQVELPAGQPERRLPALSQPAAGGGRDERKWLERKWLERKWLMREEEMKAR
jgi:hypothetical protein